MSRILVIGHINQDLPVRLSGPLRFGGRMVGGFEAPRLGGGGANASVALARAGHEVTLAGFVGTDRASDRLLDELRSQGVNVSQILRRGGCARRVLVLLEENGERTMVVEDVREPELPVDRLVEVPASCVYARSMHPRLTGLLKQRLTQGWVVAALPTDLKGTRPAHVLVASGSDLGEVEEDSLYERALRIGGPHLKWLVVTRGAEGAVAYGGSTRIDVPAQPAAVVDTTGAGDVFAAGLIHGLLDQGDIESALTTGCQWAAAAVAFPGSPTEADFDPTS